MKATHGGALTLASLPPSPAPPKTTALVHHVDQACTKPHLPPNVAKHAHRDITLINSLPLPATPAHKDFTPTPPEDPRAPLALLDATTTKPNKPLPPPAKAAMQERTHLPPTPPPASIVPQAHISKTGKAPFPNTTNVPIVKIVPLASIPNFTPIPRNVSSVHRPKSPAQLIAVDVVQARMSTSLPMILTEQQHPPRVVYALEGTTRTIVISMYVIFVQRVTTDGTRDRLLLVWHAHGVHLGSWKPPLLKIRVAAIVQGGNIPNWKL